MVLGSRVTVRAIARVSVRIRGSARLRLRLEGGRSGLSYNHTRQKSLLRPHRIFGLG